MREIYSRQLAWITGVLTIAAVTAFALVQSPEVLESPRLAGVTAGRPLPHPVPGFERCEGCHGRDAMKPYPPSHWGWADAGCMKCHPAASSTETTDVRSGK